MVCTGSPSATHSSRPLSLKNICLVSGWKSQPMVLRTPARVQDRRDQLLGGLRFQSWREGRQGQGHTQLDSPGMPKLQGWQAFQVGCAGVWQRRAV
jgi:hypothetical protein